MKKQSIQIIMSHSENQRLLKQWLSSDYLIVKDEIIRDDTGLLIIDAKTLKDKRDEIQNCKDRVDPIFFPVLLLTNQMQATLYTDGVRNYVDDVLESPTKKVILKSHIDVLLRTRKLSETMHQQSIALQEQKILSDVLLDSAMNLTSTLNVKEVFHRILEHISRIIHQDAAAIFLIENGYATIIDSHGYADELLNKTQVLLSKTPITDLSSMQEMVSTHQSVYFEDLSTLQLPCLETSAVFVMTPIYLNDKMLGFITFEHSEIITDKENISRYLRAFAMQAAYAIRNARLYARAQSVAVYEERQRLARDFHDSVTQTLFSASMIAEAIIRSNVDEDMRELLTELHQLTRGALGETRTLLLELKPTKLLETDFPDLLRQLTESLWSRKLLTIDIHLNEVVELPLRVKVAFYRIAQEALHNIRKHSYAKNVNVYYHSSNKIAEMKIVDDGIGFDVNEQKRGLGLNNMATRADSIDAKFELKSEKQIGTKVCVVWDVIEGGIDD